jgi:hypothetical protein
MRPLKSLAVAAALGRISVAVHPLPPHRLFAIFNGHPEQFAGFLGMMSAHPGSVNFASLYSYTVGAISANWTLPKGADYRPFGYNFSEGAKALGVFSAPVIQMGGAYAENNFHFAPLWTREFVNESVAFGYDGFVLDCQISKSSSARVQGEFAAFLDAFAGGLHAVNKSLVLVTRFDFPKAYVSASAVDAVMGYDYSENPLTIVGYVKEIGAKYPRTAGVLFEAYPSWVAGNNTYDEAVFAAADAAGTRTLGLWTNFEGFVGRWWEHMAAWVANATAEARPKA